MALVDVIIPFYNTNIEFARHALESVRAQTVSDWRTVLVNDGSSERSTAEIENLLDRVGDDRILYVKTPNQGLAAARNAGINASDSPYIALLDSDDAWYPYRLAMGIEQLDSDPTLDVSHADSDVINCDGRVVTRRPRDTASIPAGQVEQFRSLMTSNFVSVVTTTIRRQAIMDVGLFDPTFDSLEDKELWLRMLMHGKRLGHTPRIVSHYRVHTSNMSKHAEKMARGRRRLIEKLDRMLAEHPVISAAEWSCLRRKMLRHMYQEMAETWLESGHPWKALRYSLPAYAGISPKATVLTVRALYRGARSLSGW